MLYNVPFMFFSLHYLKTSNASLVSILIIMYIYKLKASFFKKKSYYVVYIIYK